MCLLLVGGCVYLRVCVKCCTLYVLQAALLIRQLAKSAYTDLEESLVTFEWCMLFKSDPSCTLTNTWTPSHLTHTHAYPSILSFPVYLLLLSALLSAFAIAEGCSSKRQHKLVVSETRSYTGGAPTVVDLQVGCDSSIAIAELALGL